MEKVVLVSKSQGERGDNGKKKVYEIIKSGDYSLILAWGMAEKSNRQTQTLVFPTTWHRNVFANDKRFEKMAKGYEIAYTA